ncbi:MAG: c-type cytochrome [Planctomycetia bacterium]|nr:c-type cytochrome [Planctomycetia bacterium]
MHAPAPAVWKVVLLSLAVLAASGGIARGQNTLVLKADAGEPQWIWSASHEKDNVPTGVCYFRKGFSLGNIEQAQLQISCDDRYDLYINGRQVGSGTDWRKLQSYNIARYLQSGKNVIAVRAENTSAGSAGLVVRVTAKQKGDTEVSHSTDATWKTSGVELVGWEKLEFDDSQWAKAQSYGELGRVAPWGTQVVAADGSQVTRFTMAAEFRVERVLSPDETGSLIAMTFNEFGDILASREGGPLLLITDKDQDGVHETVDIFCDDVKSCQGILALNGNVFAVGEGPEGTGMYRLADDDHDRRAESVTLILGFKGKMGEHGPHAPVLGPDGLIYLMLGNHTNCLKDADASSPHHHWYEGDLVQPKYEDAGGHAVGIKAPGGVVVRTDVDGSFVQIVAGGLRNAYDLAFNRQGELLTFDSDMEWDEGLPWYKPTRINHVTPGGEFGWRSGWSNWPEYFYDSLPATLNVGRGSPTGVVVYNHYMMPQRYHNALFACDWSQGRILAIKLTPSGGTYTAKSEVFLQGRPLNVTDIDVGQDGWLYFCTGGRGTDGGIYRVVWTGRVPSRPKYSGVVQAVRQPQLGSAWARQAVATIQEQLGEGWGRQLIGIVENVKNTPEDRARALDLMQLFGPFPQPQLLVRLARDKSPEIRAKVAYLMGLHVDDATTATLSAMLADGDLTVRRVACESFVRGGREAPAAKLLPLLADSSRYVSWAASRALERVPRDQWQAQVLSARDIRVFLVGSAALVALDDDPALAHAVLKRASELMRGHVKDTDFVDLLRLVQVALHRASLTVADVPQLAKQLEAEYPSRNYVMNRELLRLLVHLQQSEIIPRLLAELKTTAPLPERLHAAFHARFLDSGWTTEQKLELLEFYEKSRDLPGGHSYALYFDNFSRDFLAKFSEEERLQLVQQGQRAPAAALTALVQLPENPGDVMLANLIDLDGRLSRMETPSAQTLRTGIVAILARSRSPRGMAYLRERFELEPNRRQELAMGLAQEPGGENWSLLLRSLPIVEGNAAVEVLTQLTSIERTTDQPEPIRQVILCGLKLRENGAPAAKLLAKWTGQQASPEDASWDVAMSAWQQWFQKQFPNVPPPTLPTEPAGNKWTFQELASFLASPEGSHGDRQRGSVVFEKAQCVKCHRYGSRGEGIGPDLTTVSQRFQKKEIIESVVYPSQVISDQYASKTVVTTHGKQYSGIVGDGGAGAIVVLQASGEKVSIPRSEVDEIAPNAKSAMPEGLFNTLSLEEIADLFAYLSNAPKATVAGAVAPRAGSAPK